MSATATRHVEAERLSAWISGDLSERDTTVVRTHVEACSTCMDVAAALRAQVLGIRGLDRPEPPATLWSAIEGALDQAPRRRWSWPALLTGALAGAAAMVALFGGLALVRGGATSGRGERAQGQGQTHTQTRAQSGSSDGAATTGGAAPARDPLLAEAERQLEQAALSYEQAVKRLRQLLEREQVLWDPETRARVADRLARLDEAVAHSRAEARRDPGDTVGADMLFSAYQRQIDFLAEAVHRGSPGVGAGWR